MSVEVDGSAEHHLRLGKFVLLRPIRKGSGMGALSLALDVEARRIVVLKRLQSAKIACGLSTKLTADEQAKLIGDAWERLPEPRPRIILEVHESNGKIRE